LNTNFSRSISFSIFDQNQNEISVETNISNLIEIIIPRDPNIIIPPMILQNVMFHKDLFYMKQIDIKQNNNLTISIHFEIFPLNKNLSYLFIYKFDQPPKLTESINHIDNWTLFCSSGKISIFK